jgi:hypothetical protein
MDLIRSCEKNVAPRGAVLENCRESFVYWCNYWAWTYRVKELDDSGRDVPAKNPHTPFITWPVQDDVATTLIDCINTGRDVLVDKSRDMGATWICLSVLTWMYLFVPDSHFLLVSRNENALEKKGNPDCMFWKVDYLINSLPVWMRPKAQNRTHMHRDNPDINCTLDGEATTGNVGQGGRRKAILMDEFARVPDGMGMLTSTADVTGCRIYNSTPSGPGTAFTMLRDASIKSGSPQMLTLGYWDHPEKGRDRQLRRNKGEVNCLTPDQEYWWTPWLERELKRRKTDREVAENIFISHETSGDLFFDINSIGRHMSEFVKDPFRASLIEVGDNRWEFSQDPRGPWYVFDQDVYSNRIQRNTNYVIAADLSHGSGSSNSVLAVFDRDDGRLVAEFVDPSTVPHKLAEIAAVASKCVFKGHHGEAFLIWEKNGPGEGWHKELERQSCMHLYYSRDEKSRGEKRSRTYGWNSTRQTKELRLRYFSALFMRRDVIIPSQAGLREMMQYTFYPDGGIGPGMLREEMTGARAAHGDRVIAYMLGAYGISEAPKVLNEGKPVYPEGTYGYIHQQIEAQDERRKMRQNAYYKDPFLNAVNKSEYKTNVRYN